MPVDLRGIRNVGDFYSQHYLDALLGSDLDAVIQRWTAEEKEGKGKAPYKALAALEQRFFKAASRAAGERDPAERLAAAGIVVRPGILPQAALVARLAARRPGAAIDPALAAPLYVRDKVAQTIRERLGEGGKA